MSPPQDLSAFAAACALLAVLGAAAAQVVLWRRRELTALAAWLALDLAALLLVGVALASPLTFEAWMQEDAWVEWGTFYTFVAAAWVRLFELWRGRAAWRAAADQRAVWRALGGLGVALFCLLVAGEEISWGQRLFAFEPPKIFLEHNFQQELNFHNLLKNKSLAGLSLDSRYLVALIAGTYGIALAALVRDRALAARPWAELLRAAAPRLHLAPAFAAVVAVSLEYPVPLAGEAAEWFLSLLFLVDAALAQPQSAPVSLPASARLSFAPMGVALALALGTPPLLDALVFGTGEARRAQASGELQLLAQDLQRADLTALGRKRRVHKRLFTAMREGYFTLGATSDFLEGQLSPAEVTPTEPDRAAPGPKRREDRRGYFLDPWNNPYWIDARRGRATVLVYSMGANRRRDTVLDEHRAGAPLGGDDVGVELEAPPAR